MSRGNCKKQIEKMINRMTDATAGIEKNALWWVIVKSIIGYIRLTPEKNTLTIKVKRQINATELNGHKRLYSHKLSFTYCKYANSTTLSEYISQIRDKIGKSFIRKWDIVKRTLSYKGSYNNCRSCL